jgi:hypothetical protein
MRVFLSKRWPKQHRLNSFQDSIKHALFPYLGTTQKNTRPMHNKAAHVISFTGQYLIFTWTGFLQACMHRLLCVIDHAAALQLIFFPQEEPSHNKATRDSLQNLQHMTPSIPGHTTLQVSPSRPAWLSREKLETEAPNIGDNRFFPYTEAAHVFSPILPALRPRVVAVPLKPYMSSFHNQGRLNVFWGLRRNFKMGP